MQTQLAKSESENAGQLAKLQANNLKIQQYTIYLQAKKKKKKKKKKKD